MCSVQFSYSSYSSYSVMYNFIESEAKKNTDRPIDASLNTSVNLTKQNKNFVTCMFCSLLAVTLKEYHIFHIWGSGGSSVHIMWCQEKMHGISTTKPEFKYMLLTLCMYTIFNFSYVIIQLDKLSTSAK